MLTLLVLLFNAKEPIAVLKFPEVFPDNAWIPIAVFSKPEVKFDNTLYPIPILLKPVFVVFPTFLPKNKPP